MAFNTGNPIGSTDPRDFSDNSENFDRFANGQDDAYTDRFGNQRKSFSAMEDEFEAFIAASGYEFVGDYAAGITITGYQQVVRDGSGEFWRLDGATNLPYTTTGAGLPEGGAFVTVGDAALRQDLNGSVASGLGATLVKGATIYVGSVAAMEALSLPVGTNVYLTEEGRAGSGIIKSGTPPTDPQKGVNIVLANGNYWMRQYSSLTPEGGLNVKWFGATGDGTTVDTTAIQAAIDYSYGNILGFPPGDYRSGQLFIREVISIKGSLRGLDPTSYSNDTSRIDFELAGAGNYGLTIVSPDQIIGVSIENMGFRGTPVIGGLDIAGTLTGSIKDSYFTNCYWYNFETAVRMSYLISGSFRNCRLQSGVNGLKASPQCNAVLWSQCSIVTMSERAIELSNVEGMHFDTCNISNLTRTSTPITTFQSSAIFTNGYFENVTSGDMIQVGSSSEAEGVESRVIFIHPLKMGGNIRIANSKAYAELIGGCRNDTYIIGDSRESVVNGVVSGQNSVYTPETYLEIFKAGEYPDFRAYQSASFTYDVRRGFYRVTNSGSAATGAILTDDMVAGEVYTLSFAARIPTGSAASLTIRNGATILGYGDRVPDEPAVPNVLNCTFIAEGTDLIFQWTDAVDFYGYTIQKGNIRELDTKIFATPTSRRVPVVGTVFNAAPTNGSWIRGDRVYQTTTSAGDFMGWVCVGSGTPGTWKTFGAIEA